MSASDSSGTGRRAPSPRSFDPTMKERESQLFQVDEITRAAWARSSKPFRQHLRDTKAAPLGLWVRVLLWVAALLVTALFLLAAYQISQPRRPTPREAPRPSGSKRDVGS